MESMFRSEGFYHVRQLFEDRAEEVKRLINFNVVLTDTKANKLAYEESSGTGGDARIYQEYVIERELLKTFKASVFLVLYNLVESTMANAVDAIHQSMASDDYDFSKLSESMKKITLNNFKSGIKNINTKENVLTGEDSLKKIAMTYGYNKNFLFSGNISAKTIKDCAKKYGFDIADHDKEKSQSGERIVDIKEKRNHLAHGNISFEDCGKEVSPEELVSLFEETVTYLNAVLDGVESFILEKKYLREEERIN